MRPTYSTLSRVALGLSGAGFVSLLIRFFVATPYWFSYLKAKHIFEKSVNVDSLYGRNFSYHFGHGFMSTDDESTKYAFTVSDGSILDSVVMVESSKEDKRTIKITHLIK